MSTVTVVEQNNITDSRKGTFIVTYTGKLFYPLDVRPEEVDIVDIAHHLSNVCRYTGAVRDNYNVAEHSIRAAQIAIDRYDAEVAFDVLMHDASEAYIADLSRPVKALDACVDYLRLEEEIMTALAGQFEFNWPMTPEVKEIDDEMLLWEWQSLMPLNENMTGPFFDAVRAYDEREVLTPIGHKLSEGIFLNLFYNLQKELGV